MKCLACGKWIKEDFIFIEEGLTKATCPRCGYPNVEPIYND